MYCVNVVEIELHCRDRTTFKWDAMVLQYYFITSLLLLSLSGRAHLSSDGLQWLNVSNALERGALCNDFSTAGYFVRTQYSPNKSTMSRGWIIYLESGGGCTTPESCNTRFIHQPVRNNYTSTKNKTLFVDVQQAWADNRDNPLAVTSRLMTSLWRFSEDSRRDESTWMVDGRGILSTDQIENPDFYDYNHVVVPYCSSDLWLKKTKEFIIAKNNSFRFHFDPNAKDHQFTFRGAAIFVSVIEDLFEQHGLSSATDVILVGSSAGGIGAMNHAPWLRNQLHIRAGPHITVYCLMDSSWFIDFRGSIRDQFAPDEILPLIETGEVVDSCRDVSDDPSVCISSLYFLTHYKDLLKDIPTFALFSRYDLYLLISSLQHVDMDILEIMRIVSEYSGSMNASLSAVATEVPNLSYYVTSCFQHVYLATSTLWGEGGVLGTAGIDGELENNRFGHIISSEVWTKFHLEHLNTSLVLEHISIQKAIHYWLEAVKSGLSVRYHDQCSGPHCNVQCPETIVLGENTPYWEVEAQAVLLAIVVFVSLSCVVMKVLLSVRAYYHSRNQKQFVEWNRKGLGDNSESALPQCKDIDAISVACLNLRYSVTVKQMDLKKVSSPAQRKRLLSLAAADGESGRMSRCEAGEDEMQQLDSDSEADLTPTTETEENDFAKSVKQFQQMHHNNKNKQKGRFKGSLHGNESSRKKRKKVILKGITTYFNPGELVAIMGPSGCGKTTFLDLLAGRRSGRDNYQGEIYINGISMDEIRDWYVANTGYVLQLAMPYYEELTVRENVTLAAQIRLPKSLSVEERFERVEQVMRETGLYSLASTVVGGVTGPGLSGGQKRRLCVALQLINMPSLIFLDEPTSGLDATSSLELLSHLHRVASSNRAVVLTIHQPRLEIFHMFDKVILLCQGQIAYHGIPDKAYEVFLEANQAEGKKVDSLKSKNPADAIMDMLGSEESRASILSYYQTSDEPEAVENAIEEVRNVGRESVSSRQVWAQRPQQESGVLNRLSCLETRASMRAGLGQVLYLPLIFIVYGLLLGTVYIQTTNPTFILSGYGVFSCASGLFMFPIVYTYLYRALEIFSLEYSDGVGSPIELVLQTFLRFTSLALLPNLVCSTAIYFLAVPYSKYDPWVFSQITTIAISINHTWIALVIFVLTAQPGFAHRISPVLSAIAGFAGGFFVPPKLMPPWYSWLFYINPNYYGFSAMARILLQEIELGCQYQSPIECYPSSSAYILTYFDLHTINPYLNLLVLLTMTAIFLGLAWLSLSYRHSYIMSHFKKLFAKKNKSSTSSTTSKYNHPKDILTPSLSMESITLNQDNITEEFKKVTIQPVRRLSLSTSDLSVDEVGIMTENRRFRLRNRITVSRMLQDGEKHQVWTPGNISPTKTASQSSQASLEERRRTLFQRIKTVRSNSNNNQPKHPPKKGALNVPCRDNIARRIAQWKKIEEEARKLKEEDSEPYSSPTSPLMSSAYLNSNKLPKGPEVSTEKTASCQTLGIRNHVASVNGIGKLPSEKAHKQLAVESTLSQPNQAQYFVFPEVLGELTTKDSHCVDTPDTGGARNLSASSGTNSIPSFHMHNVLNVQTPQGIITSTQSPHPVKTLPAHTGQTEHTVTNNLYTVPGSPLVFTVPPQETRRHRSNCTPVMDSIIEETSSEASSPSNSLSESRVLPLMENEEIDMEERSSEDCGKLSSNGVQITPFKGEEIGTNDHDEKTHLDHFIDSNSCFNSKSALCSMGCIPHTIQDIITTVEKAHQDDTIRSSHITDRNKKAVMAIRQDNVPIPEHNTDSESHILSFPFTLEKMSRTLEKSSILQLKEGLHLRNSSPSESRKHSEKHNKVQPQQRQPLALSLHKRVTTSNPSTQEVTKPQRGNIGTGLKTQETYHTKHNINLKPIPVSSPTNNLVIPSPRQSNFQNDAGEIYQQTNDFTTTQLIYVARSPTSQSNDVKTQPEDVSHIHYQQTDF